VYSLRFYEADIIIHEQVVGWEEDLFCKILGARSTSHLRCPYSRLRLQPSFASVQASYGAECRICNPKELGIPVDRKRKYACWWLKPFLQRDDLKGSGCKEFYFEMFARRLTCFGDVFLVATQDMVDAEHRVVVAGRRGASISEMDNVTAALSNSEVLTLEGFDSHVRTSGMSLADVPMAIANLRHAAEYLGSPRTELFPTLMCSSSLFELKRRRYVLASELWLVQGFLVADMPGVPDDIAVDCPFPLLTASQNEEFSPLAQRLLVGNTMHWSVVGTLLLYVLATANRDVLRNARV
jgi:hypothetical protein